MRRHIVAVVVELGIVVAVVAVVVVVVHDIVEGMERLLVLNMQLAETVVLAMVLSLVETI